MKQRVIILLAVALAFAATVVAFPETPSMKPSRLAKNLPTTFAGWVGQPSEPGEREKAILARDTEFERALYFQPDQPTLPVEASIVFSGKNLSQSIHQPEVCLRAQGWTFVTEKYLVFEGLLPNGEKLPMKEMICKRPMMKKVEGPEEKLVPELLPNGKPKMIWRAFYYTFFGHEAVVSGHYQRTIVDMKDRLLKGYDQRWAYATFSAYITAKHQEQGYRLYPERVEVLDQEKVKAHIQTFLKELLPQVLAAPGKGYDESLASGKNLGT